MCLGAAPVAGSLGPIGAIVEPKFANLMTVEDISILKGTAFEEYLAAVFIDLGYSVDLTPFSGDFGADLILSKGDERIAVQAKQYAKPVGFDAVKEVHFARSYYSASQAWVVATHGFTPQAVNAAASANVRLIDGKELLSFASQARGKARQNGSTVERQNVVPFDSELLKACILVVNSRNALSVFLQSELNIGPERASVLLKRMDAIGVTKRNGTGKRDVISKAEFVDLVDDRYDASLTSPRFSGDGYSYEVFRGEGPDGIVVVESPETYPTFYSFEIDPDNRHSLVNRWVCVGVDSVEDVSDADDLRRRKDKVSTLKLYNVLSSIDVQDKACSDFDILDPSTRVFAEFSFLGFVLNDVRSGKAKIEKPDFAKRRAEQRAHAEKNRIEAERRQAAEQQRRTKEAWVRNGQQIAAERERNTKTPGFNMGEARLLAIPAAALIITLAILASCSC